MAKKGRTKGNKTWLQANIVKIPTMLRKQKENK